MVYKSVKLKVSNTFKSSPNSLVLLIASYLRFTIVVADVDELKRTFLLCASEGVPMLPGVTLHPMGRVQHFHAWCPLRPRAQLKSVDFWIPAGFIWTSLGPFTHL